ncbi:MAG: DUF1778 domain-containing protein [Synergistaceae bacterium]|jgi:uncharacterized protein (DUF1778 family)|nr:DUF1778 domain-containing protein [Synergistaceae bacterium]
MDDYTKAVLDMAAKYTNQTRSTFVLSVARERAEAIIQERYATMREVAPMILSPRDSKIFLEALERDYEPSPALLDLKKRYDSLDIVDET